MKWRKYVIRTGYLIVLHARLSFYFRHDSMIHGCDPRERMDRGRGGELPLIISMGVLDTILQPLTLLLGKITCFRPEIKYYTLIVFTLSQCVVSLVSHSCEL